MLFLTLLFTFFNIILTQIPEHCFGYTLATNLCLTCDYLTYPSMATNTSLTPDKCQLKKNEIYEKTVYISNISVCNSGICNGTLTNPYNNIFLAFETEMKLMNQYKEIKYNFLMMESIHYMIRKDLYLYGVKYRQYFRRMNVSIYWGPYVCTTQTVINGCFIKNLDGSFNVKPIIFLKTTEFFFFIANSMIIDNINFDGRMSHVYNVKTIDTKCSETYANCISDWVALYYKIAAYSLVRVYWEFRQISYGFFNLEGFMDDPLMKKPILTIINSNFSYFYPMGTDFSWISLVLLSDVPSDLIISNTSFYDGEMYFGFLYNIEFGRDSFYKYYDNLNIKFSKSLNRNVIICNSSVFYYNSMEITFYGTKDNFKLVSIFNFHNFFDKNSFITLDNIYIFSIGTKILTRKLSLISAMYSRNINISNINIKDIYAIYGIMFYECNINITLNNITINNYNYLDVFFWAQNSTININLLSCIRVYTTSGNKGVDSLEAFNSKINITYSYFQNYNYPQWYFIETELIIDNVVFKDLLIYYQFIYVVSTNLTFVNSALNGFTSLNIFDFIETTNTDVDKFNLITFSNSSFRNVDNKKGYFFTNLNDGNNDFFKFHHLIFENATFLNVIKSISLGQAELKNISYINGSSQFINILKIRNYILIDDFSIINCFFAKVFMITQSLTGEIQLKNFAKISNLTIKNNIFIQFTAITLRYDDISLRNFSFDYPKSTEQDFFVLVANNIYINNVTVILRSINIRNFFLISNTINLSVTNLKFDNNDSLANLSSDYIINNSITTSNFSSYLTIFLVKYSKDTFFENITVNNLMCYKYGTKMGEKNGLLIFLETDEIIPKKTTINSFTLKNLYFSNISKCQRGCMSFLNINNIKLHNMNFYYVSTDTAGAVSILCSIQVIISNWKVINSSSLLEAGVVELQLIENLELGYFNWTNISAESGGGINAIKIDKFYIHDGLVTGSYVKQNAGVFYIETSFVTFDKVKIYNAEANVQGGVLYISYGSAKLFNLYTYNSKAESGGVLFISISDYTVVEGSLFENSFTRMDGINVVINECIKFEFINLILRNASTTYGDGNIYIENQNKNSHFIKGLTVEYSKITLGNCIYSSSNDNITLIDIYFYNNQGVLLYFSAPSENYLIILRGLISNNNEGLILSNANCFYLKNVVFYADSLNITGIQAKKVIFEFSLSSIIFNYCFFYNLTKINSMGDITFISVSEFDLTIKNSIFDNNYIPNSICSQTRIELKPMGILTLSYTDLLMVNSSFLNSFSSEKAPIYINSGSLTIEDSVFKCNTGKSIGLIMVYTANIIVSNSIFHNNTDYNVILNQYSDSWISDIYASKLSTSDNSFISIINCSFRIYLGIGILSQTYYKTEIYNCDFVGIITKLMDSSIYYCLAFIAHDNNKVIFSKSNTNNLFSNYGSALVFLENIKRETPNNITIINNNFNKGYSLNAGVFWIKGDFLIVLIGNTFLGNKAIKKDIRTGIAGVGLNLCYKCKINSFIIANNKFISNYAEDFAPTILSLSKLADNIDKINIFIENYDGVNFTNTVTCFPLHLFFINYSIMGVNGSLINSHLINYTVFKEIELPTATNPAKRILQKNSDNLFAIASGQLSNFSIIMTDYYNKTLLFNSLSSGKIIADGILVEHGNCDSLEGVFIFQEAKINKDPNTFFSLQIQLSMKINVFYPLYYDDLSLFPDIVQTMTIPTYSRPCIIGERFNPQDFSCTQCPYDQYSLIDPMVLYNESKGIIQCKNCPENAICWNGDRITPKKGYWRGNNNTILILECISKESCLGFVNGHEHEENVYIHGMCAEHHNGPFCYICEKGYARLSTKALCEICKNNPWVYLKLIVAVIAIFCYIGVQVKITFKANNSTYSGILLKLLMNHFQQISMISLVKLGWTPDIKEYFDYQEYFSFISQELISVDCFIQDLPADLYAQKVVFSNVLPILLSIIAFFIWIVTWSVELVLKHKLNFKNYIFNRTKVTMLIITYILFPEVLRKCFSLMNCIEIDDKTGEQVLALSPSTYCWRKDHINFLLIGTLPGLLVWGFVTPLFLVFLLFKFRNQIKENIRIMQKRHSIIVKQKIKSKNKSNPSSNSSKSRINNETTLKDNSFNTTTAKKSLQKPNIGTLIIEENNADGTKNPNVTKVFIGSNSFLLAQSSIAPKPIKGNIAQKSPIKEYKQEKETDSNPQSQNFQRQTDPELKQIDTFNKNVKGGDDKTMIFINNKEESKDLHKKESFKRMTSNLKELERMEKDLQREFGSLMKFLYKGYSSKYHYWEIVLYVKKIILIFIGSFSEFFPSTTKATILLIILTYFLFLQTKKKPYENYFLNNIEYYSLIVTFLTSNVGIMLFTVDLQPYSQYLLTVMIIVNILFLTLWGYYFYLHVIKANDFNLLIRLRQFRAFCVMCGSWFNCIGKINKCLKKILSDLKNMIKKLLFKNNSKQ